MDHSKYKQFIGKLLIYEYIGVYTITKVTFTKYYVNLTLNNKNVIALYYNEADELLASNSLENNTIKLIPNTKLTKELYL